MLSVASGAAFVVARPAAASTHALSPRDTHAQQPPPRLGVWKQTVPAINPAAASDFVWDYLGGVHECGYISDTPGFDNPYQTNVRNQKYANYETNTTRYRKYKGSRQHNSSLTQDSQAEDIEWLCFKAPESVYSAADFPYLLEHEMQWTTYQEWQIHFVHPRQSLNGGGPLSLEALYSMAGSDTSDHTGKTGFNASYSFLFDYHRISLTSANDLTPVLLWLLLDKYDVRVRSTVADEIHEEFSEAHSKRREAQGKGDSARGLVKGTLLVQIPGSAWLEIEGYIEEQVFEYALARTMLVEQDVRTTRASLSKQLEEQAHRFGMAPVELALRAGPRQGWRNYPDPHHREGLRSSLHHEGTHHGVKYRYTLRHLTLTSSEPQNLAAVLKSILQPEAPVEARTVQRPSAWCGELHGVLCVQPMYYLSGIPLVIVGTPLINNTVEGPHGRLLRLFEEYLLLLRGDFSLRSYTFWEPFMDYHPGIMYRDCAPLLQTLKTARIDYFIAEQGDATSVGSLFLQEPHSGNVIEVVCTDWPIPISWRDSDIWYYCNDDWHQKGAKRKLCEPQRSTINEASHPERWKAMHRKVTLLKAGMEELRRPE